MQGSVARVADARRDCRLTRETGGPKCLVSRWYSSREHRLVSGSRRLDYFRKRPTRSLEQAGIQPAPKPSRTWRSCLWMCARTTRCARASKRCPVVAAALTCSSTTPVTSWPAQWRNSHQRKPGLSSRPISLGSSGWSMPFCRPCVDRGVGTSSMSVRSLVCRRFRSSECIAPASLPWKGTQKPYGTKSSRSTFGCR